MLRRFGLLTILLATGLAINTRADIQFSDGVTGNLDDENVLFENTADVGVNYVQGHTNQSNTLVDFNSDDLIHGSGGQALIEGCSGNAPNGSCTGTFDDIVISLTNPPGGNYTSLIFNLNAEADGDVTVTAVDGFGTTWTATSSLNNIDDLSGNGQNFYTVVAINGQDIQSVTITSTVGLADIRQIRIGTADATNPPQAIPEPASVLLLGTLVAGVGVYRKRFACKLS
jgi:hypothetical protein